MEFFRSTGVRILEQGEEMLDFIELLIRHAQPGEPDEGCSIPETPYFYEKQIRKDTP